jgi:hypothetical protein
MQDEKDSGPDADQVREEMHSAVQRIRKKFSERIAPDSTTPIAPGEPSEKES